MEQAIFNELLPPLLFFIIFTLGFIFLELILTVILGSLEKSHWEFMIDVVIRAKVHHGRLIKYSILIFLAALVGFVLLKTPVVDVLAVASPEFKIFAVCLALVMILFYLINIRKSSQVAIERKIYAVIFFIVSVILYGTVLVVAHETYDEYARYVNLKLIRPVAEKVGSTAEERERQMLLDKFRELYLKNGCFDVDYREEEKKGRIVKNFMIVGFDPDLAYGTSKFDPEDPRSELKGKECSDGENTFLITEKGEWYWVIEEYYKVN